MTPLDVLEREGTGIGIDSSIDTVLADVSSGISHPVIESPKYHEAKYTAGSVNISDDDMIGVIAHDLRNPANAIAQAAITLQGLYEFRRIEDLGGLESGIDEARSREIEKRAANDSQERLKLSKVAESVLNLCAAVNSDKELYALDLGSSNNSLSGRGIDFAVEMARLKGLKMQRLFQEIEPTLGYVAQKVEMAQQMLDILKESIPRYLRTVQELPDFIKLVKREATAVSQTDVANLVAGIADSHKHYAQTRGVKVSYSASGYNPDVSINQDLLRDILVNLLTNAIKYSKGGEVNVAVKNDGDNLRVSVSDHGKGMEKITLKELIEARHAYKGQLSDNDLGDIERSGFGFLKAKLCANLLGANIEAKSLEAHGSEFTVVIPTSPVAKYLAGVGDNVKLSDLVQYAANKAGYKGKICLDVRAEHEFPQQQRELVEHFIETLTAYYQRMQPCQERIEKSGAYRMDTVIGNGQPGLAWMEATAKARGDPSQSNRYERRKERRQGTDPARDSVSCSPERFRELAEQNPNLVYSFHDCGDGKKKARFEIKH